MKCTNDVQVARNDERLRLEKINDEIKEMFNNEINKLKQEINDLKLKQENDIRFLQKKHEHLIRETTIHYNQRLEELTSELQSSANKIVVQDIRLKKMNNENRTLSTNLQHSHMLCANMISLLKAADHYILREYRKKQLLINGLTFVTNEYSNTYNRKNMLETYFGGLALKDGTSSFNTTIDLSNNRNNNVIIPTWRRQ